MHKKLKWLIGGVAATACLLLAWRHVGIVEDPEFSDEHHVVWKAHPTFQIWFRSPVGMSDLRLEDLPPDAQAEEKAYRYYVLGEPVEK